ncbi:hypothetical protein ACQ4PT_054675 [Festuca glaucescens]
MAQKRAAKRSARPPPPPPASSSEEIDSRSRSEESEDEAVSRTPTPSKPLAPLQRPEESDSSDEGEEGDEEEEEEAPNNPPAPPQKGEESESSDDDEDGDKEEEEPTHLAAPSAPMNQPPPPQQSNESDASDEEGESSESDEEAPPPKQALKREAEDIKPPSAKKARLAFHRIWSIDDEVRILEALAAHQKQHGALPQPDVLIGALAGKLDNRAYSSKELQSKLQTLKKRYVVLSNRGELPSKEHERRLLDLSNIIWGGDKTTTAAVAAKAGSSHELKGFEEMCELYPYLTEEVKRLEATHPGMFRRVFGKMDDGKVRAMDEKIKKQRIAQMKVELRRAELSKEVAKAIAELVE